jgi:hypothetical protein
MVLKYDDGSIGQRTERAYSWKNQSLLGLANRLLRHKIAEEDPTTNFYVNLVDLDFRTTNAIIVAVGLALCMFYIGSMPRRSQRTADSDALEYAMLLLLILLFSPYTFGYFYVWLLYPVAAMVRLWLAAPKSSRESWLLPAVMGAVIALAAMSLVWQREAEAYGNHFAACLLLLGALGRQLHKCRPGWRPSGADPGLIYCHFTLKRPSSRDSRSRYARQRRANSMNKTVSAASRTISTHSGQNPSALKSSWRMASIPAVSGITAANVASAVGNTFNGKFIPVSRYTGS